MNEINYLTGACASIDFGRIGDAIDKLYKIQRFKAGFKDGIYDERKYPDSNPYLKDRSTEFSEGYVLGRKYKRSNQK